MTGLRLHDCDWVGYLSPASAGAGANATAATGGAAIGAAEGAVLEYPGCGICIARGTKVLIADGSTNAIEDVVVGDFVLSDDPTDGSPPEAQEVEELHQTATYRLLHIQAGGQAGREVFFAEDFATVWLHF